MTYTFIYSLIFYLQIIREFEIVAVGELELQFEFIIAPKGPVPIIFKDRSEKLHDDKYENI